jgi:hypothetical protein
MKCAAPVAQPSDGARKPGLPLGAAQAGLMRECERGQMTAAIPGLGS